MKPNAVTARGVMAPGLVVGFLAFLVLPMAVAAEPPGPGPAAPRQGPPHAGGPPEGWVDKHAATLGLTPEVRKKIHAIVDRSHVQNAATREKLRVTHQELSTLLEQDAPDEAAVVHYANTIGLLEGALRAHKLRALLRIRGLMTPEQRKQLVEVLAKNPRRPGPRRGPRPRTACHEDIGSRCGDATPGRGVLGCLGTHWDELSESCRTSFEAGPPQGQPRPPGPRAGVPGGPPGAGPPDAGPPDAGPPGS